MSAAADRGTGRGLAFRELRGSVVAFDEARGIGEVRVGDGTCLAFHCTQITDGSRRIALGTPVSFVVVAGCGGRWEAARISPERAT